MTLDKPKALKYLVLFIVCLLLLFFGSTIMSIFLAGPLKSITGYSSDTLNTALDLLQNYFSNEPCKYDEMMTWNEYAVAFFEADPVLFKDIKVFFCALQFLSYVPLLILIIYFLRQEFAEDFKKFKKDAGKNIIYIIVGIIGMYAASIIITVIYEMIGISGESSNESTINLLLDGPGVGLMVVAVVVLAPIVEEVIFRKLLFGTCETMGHFPPALTILISALIFSLIHVTDGESLKYIFQYIALALPICIVYHMSGNNIYVTICMHIINNLISVLVTMFI